MCIVDRIQRPSREAGEAVGYSRNLVLRTYEVIFPTPCAGLIAASFTNTIAPLR